MMKPLDPVRLARVRNAVQEALSFLLDHLQTEGIMYWHQRYVGIGEELERDNYDLVVKTVRENHEVSTREAERMDLLPHYLDSEPQEESERLERGHRKHAKYHKAFIYSLQLLRATDTLRVYTSYRIFNEPTVIQKLR